MKHLFCSALLVSTTVITAHTAHAAFQPNLVSGDAQWVLYLDFESLRDSVIGKEVVALAAKHQAENNTSGIQVDFAKLLTTVGSITAYGSNFSQDAAKIDGTLVIQGNSELRKIAEGVVAQQSVSAPEQWVEVKDLPFEAWNFNNGIYIAFPQEPVVIVSKSKDQLGRAHQLLRGQGSSLAKANASPIAGLLKPKKRAFFHAASIVPSAEISSNAPQARILQMTKSASVSLGEDEGRTFAHVELLASSDDLADKLMKIVQGVVAMASLAETNDKQLGEFLQSMKVQRDDRTVTLDLAYSSERLAVMARNMRDESRPAKQERRARNDGKLIAEWTADQDLGHDGPNAANLVERTIENVALVQGATVVIRGTRQGGENARLDVVELHAAEGGKPLRFEAENMVWQNYRAETFAAASGGKLVMLGGGPTGTARFQFPAADGTYTIKLRYVDENDGKATFRVSVKTPDVQKDQAEHSGPEE